MSRKEEPSEVPQESLTSQGLLKLEEKWRNRMWLTSVGFVASSFVAAPSGFMDAIELSQTGGIIDNPGGVLFSIGKILLEASVPGYLLCKAFEAHSKLTATIVERIILERSEQPVEIALATDRLQVERSRSLRIFRWPF